MLSIDDKKGRERGEWASKRVIIICTFFRGGGLHNAVGRLIKWRVSRKN